MINKFSGTGYSPKVEGMITDFCAAHQLEATLEFTRERGHAQQLARQASESKFDIVVAMGGDGTVNEVAQGLLHSSTCMAILPKGSGNGLARHLKIPLGLRSALEILVHHEVIRMDAIDVNGRLSVNVSGAGFDGHIANLFDRGPHRGLLGYARLVLREYFTYREAPVKLELDGRAYYEQLFVIAFANSSQFGNNAKIAPKASVSDGWMDACLVKKVPLHQLPAFAWQLFQGRIQHSGFATIIPCRTLTADFQSPCAYHVDGEACGTQSTFSVNLLPGVVNMLVPNTGLADTH